MSDLLAASWTANVQYLAALGGLTQGQLDAWAVLAAIGIACLVVGVALSIAWREKQAWWMLLPAAVAALTPLWLGLAYAVLGWLALTLMLIVGAILLLVWMGLIANDATRRLPVWLIGLFVLTVAASSGVGTFLTRVAL